MKNPQGKKKKKNFKKEILQDLGNRRQMNHFRRK